MTGAGAAPRVGRPCWQRKTCEDIVKHMSTWSSSVPLVKRASRLAMPIGSTSRFTTSSQQSIALFANQLSTEALAAVLDSMIVVGEDAGGQSVYMKYTCATCGKKLPDRRDMKRHCETHLDVTYICELCQKACKTRNALRQHYSAYHKS